MKKQLVIIGGGPAGLAAALSAREHGIQDIIVLEREMQAGGILNQCIHDGFGLFRFGAMLTGPEYAQRDIKLAQQAGIEISTDTMVTGLTRERVVTAVNREGIVCYEAEAVILATGCRERTRGAIAIPGTRPAGVYTAGVVQNLTNMHNVKIGSRVVILGSGDIGLIVARRLMLEGIQVLAMVEIGKEPGGLQRNVTQCLYEFNIPLYTNHTVTEIVGKQRVEAVVISEVNEKGQVLANTQQTIACDTVILSVGLIPENELAQGAGIALDEKTNGVCCDDYLQTSLPGVFACGNAKKVLDLADYVSAEGKLAGENAAHFVKNKPQTAVSAVYFNPMPKGLPTADGLICVLCPRGCRILQKDDEVVGNQCARGMDFFQQEKQNPQRILTLTMRTESGCLAPVRSSAPLPQKLLLEAICLCKTHTIGVGAYQMGDVVIQNILNSGADIVLSKDYIEKPADF